MSVLIKHMAMPKGCIYANDKDQTEYCPLLNHDEVPFCQYIENEPEIAIGIDERPVYCPLSDVPEPCQDTVSRQAAIDALTHKWDGMVTSVFDVINSLPSAQPEIIICLDCVHYEPLGKEKAWGRCSVHSSPTDNQRFVQSCDFCAWAERRTDATTI